jgi:hypothetical protein
MASQTATWAIPYPQSTDRFCDGYLFTQEMAERVDAILDDFDTDFTRVEFPPAAEVSLSADHVDTNPVGEVVPWDTVEFDTASMVNLSLRPTAIVLTSDVNSIYIGGGDIIQTSSGSAGSWYDVSIVNTSDVRDNGATFVSNISVSALEEVTAGGTAAVVALAQHLGTAVTALTTKAGSRMYAYWIGDL